MADTVQSPAEKLKVFISYARADGAALAEELVTGLELTGFEAFLDRHDIKPGEPWEDRLGGLIQSADTIVVIISAGAVKSGRIAREVDRANELGKRLIPIQLIPIQGQPVPESDVPERLRRLNYIFFRDGQSSLKPLTDSSIAPLSQLTTALREDVEWIREHTRLSEIAARWDARRNRAGGEADDLLLRGDDLTDARAWVARRREDAPEITALQRSYLAASESFAKSLAEAEKKRLEERERLIAQTEAAQQARRRFQRRMFGVLAGLAVLVVLGTGAGLWSVFTSWQKQMIDRSQFVAEVVEKKVEDGAYVDAMMIGLDALPDKVSLGIRARLMPLEGSALNAFDKAWRKWASNWAERTNLAGHTNAVRAVTFSPDGRRVLTGSLDKTARLWDAKTGAAVTTLGGHTSAVIAVAFAPDGNRVLTGSWDKTAKLWDAATGAVLVTLQGHKAPLSAVAFSPDGTRVLTGSDDSTARLWDAATGAAIATLDGHTAGVNAVTFSLDGERALTGSDDGTARLWDTKTGAEIATLRGHTAPVHGVAFSPDGTRVLTGAWDKTARLWNAATGAAVATLDGHTDPVEAVAFSPDGKRIVTGAEDKTARVWDASTGASVATLKGHDGDVNAAAFSPDGKPVLTGSVDMTARLWDAATGTPVATLEGRTGSVFVVAFSPDGARVLVGSVGATLWDTSTGVKVATLEGHTGSVFAVAISPDGARILIGSDDNTIRLWDAATGAVVATLEGHAGGVNAVAFSPDGRRVLTGSDDHTAWLWAVFPSAQDVVDEVKASAPRCLTPKERKDFHLREVSRWCYARNLWPHLDHGPPETPGSSPPYGPPAMTWDEKVTAFWDRLTSWLAPSEPQSTRAEAAIKSP
jgi:WD40 repeat protein